MLYQPDIIIAWDFSDKDCPAVGISRTYAKGMHVNVDVLDVFHTETGVCSVNQLMAEFERRQNVQASSVES